MHLKKLETDIPIGFSKVSLHCCRRDCVTKSECLGADVDVVRKAMRVKTVENIHQYASLSFNQLKVVPISL